MNKGTIAGILATLILVGAGVYTVLQKPSGTDSAANTGQSQTQTKPTTVLDPTVALTTAEVAQHTDKNSCWTIIDGNVYDVTSFISSHPGGDRILEACGKDGSQLFASQGGEGSHSESARGQLNELLIGALQN